MMGANEKTFGQDFTASMPSSADSTGVVDRSIGDIIRQSRNLTDEQIEQILLHQRSHGVRFGEAAVALNLASGEDVLWALSQQFHYPYALKEGEQVNEELVAAIDPFCDQSEAFRELRSQLIMGVLGANHPRRGLAVVSANVGDGKTFFAANLAIALSQLGGRTLLVDADMRTSRMHRLFGIDNRGGLSTILSGRTEASVIHRVPQLPSLFVLPAGTTPPNPLELIQRAAFTLLVQELLDKFDHVIVDTPAATHGADARVIGSKCGAALTIARRGKTEVHAMQKLISGLQKGSAVHAGVVLNDY